MSWQQADLGLNLVGCYENQVLAWANPLGRLAFFGQNLVTTRRAILTKNTGSLCFLKSSVQGEYMLKSIFQDKQFCIKQAVISK